MVNKWTDAEVKRAEGSWGQKIHPYTRAMFDFATEECKSWLDLGCGFGRYLNYLTGLVDEPDYIGYDASPDMVARIAERFPIYQSRVFCRDITLPISNPQESVICSAVLIHLPYLDQAKILKNVYAVKPKRFAFDINCPEPHLLKGKTHFERLIKGAEGPFRMTWQDHGDMTNRVLSIFTGYSLSINFYVVNRTRHKALYMLERTGQ